MSTLTITNLTCPDTVVPAGNGHAGSASDGAVIFCLDRSPNTFRLTLATTGKTVTVKKNATITLTFDKANLLMPSSLAGAPEGWSYGGSKQNSKDFCITRTGDEIPIASGTPAVFDIAGVTANSQAKGSSSLRANFKDVVNAPRDTEFSVTFQNAAVAGKNLPLICSFDQESGGIVYVGSSGGSNWKGPWSASASYDADDGVSYQGSSWKAVQANTNVTPAEGVDWKAVTITTVNNDLSFTIEYTDTSPAANATPEVKITVWFDSCPDGKQPRALATDDKIAQIKLAVERQDGTSWSLDSALPDKNNRWHLTPANGTPVFNAGGNIKISVSGIESFQDAGRSNMYIQFASVDEYNDCTMFVPIDKFGPYRFEAEPVQVTDLSYDFPGTDHFAVYMWTGKADEKQNPPPYPFGPLQVVDRTQVSDGLARIIDSDWTSGARGLVFCSDSTSPANLMFKFSDKGSLVDVIKDPGGGEPDNQSHTILENPGLPISRGSAIEKHTLILTKGMNLIGELDRLPVYFVQVQAGQERDYKCLDLSNLDLSNLAFDWNAGNGYAILLNSTRLAGTSFAGAHLAGAEFNSADLTNADLTGANWDYVWIANATIDGVKMDAADLAAFQAIWELQNNPQGYGTSADFASRITGMTAGRQLKNAALQSDSLANGYRFDNVTFPNGFSFAGAWLRYASFQRATLKGADLTGADLTGADLTGADLTKAILTKANISGADLTGARLAGVISSGIQLDANTKLSMFAGASDYIGPGFVTAAILANDTGSGHVIADTGSINSAAAKNAMMIPSASLAMPVPDDETCKLEITRTENLIVVQDFVRIAGIVGTPQKIPLKPAGAGGMTTDEVQAVSDGFVVATALYKDGSGSVIGKQLISEWRAVAGASFYAGFEMLPTNSFCMPVTINTKYRVDLEFPDGVRLQAGDNVQVWFVPVSLLVPFGKSQISEGQLGNTGASEDGFLLAFLQAKGGESGRVDIFVNTKNVASASVGGAPFPLLCNSATVAVQKGATYSVDLPKTADNLSLQVMWLPLKSPGT